MKITSVLIFTTESPHVEVPWNLPRHFPDHVHHRHAVAGRNSKSTYANAMGPLLSPTPNLWAAGAFYLLFPVGLLIFAVLPQADSPVWKAALMGALFGFFAYSTYDLTNLAVVKDWPLGLTFIDMAWGTIVSGIAATAGKLALDYLNA